MGAVAILLVRAASRTGVASGFEGNLRNFLVVQVLHQVSREIYDINFISTLTLEFTIKLED